MYCTTDYYISYPAYTNYQMPVTANPVCQEHVIFYNVLTYSTTRFPKEC